MSKPEPDFSKGKQGFLHSLQCVLQCKVCLLLQHGKHVTQLDSQFFVDFMKGYSAVSRWFRQVNTTQKSTCVVAFICLHYVHRLTEKDFTNTQGQNIARV